MLVDNEIISLFLERSEQAIKELSDKYGALCGCVARNILNDDQDAEECVNDAYLGVWNTIPPQKPTRLQAYVCQIVRNLSLKKYHANAAAKRNSHYDTALDELEACLAAPVSVEDQYAAKELGRLINNFLGTLDKQTRMIFVRRYWYADSIADISAQYHMTENNVYVRLSRTRDKLKQYLKKEGFLT